MLRLAVTIEKIEQLEVLLNTVKLLGLTPDLGTADEPSPRRKQYRRKERSTKASKPKRYKPSMQIRLGPEPTEGPPKLVVIHRALKKKFGVDPFRKGDAKQAIIAKMGNSTGYVTKLLDRGNLVAA
jgi:hypothetical protein